MITNLQSRLECMILSTTDIDRGKNGSDRVPKWAIVY